MIEISLSAVALLTATGFIAGIINTLAGGGSNLTIPALMVMGMPADVANATNRLGVMMHSVSTTASFHRYKKLETADVLGVMLPTLFGGLAGAILATVLPVNLLKPLLLGTMVSMSLLILLKPSVIAPPPGTPSKKVAETQGAKLALFIAGVYGGFVQAGVGFVLIAALAGTLRYDILRANALKVLCIGAFTLVSLLVFVFADLVLWVPGLILGLSTMLGGYMGVRVSLDLPQSGLKWFVFLMTVAASAAALLT